MPPLDLDISLPPPALDGAARMLKDPSRHAADLEAVTTIHTLGPNGTNCEAAARHWLARRGRVGGVVLHPTLEDGQASMPLVRGHALLGCAVYPDLHRLVFDHLDRMVLADCFIMPTHPMVLAARRPGVPGSVASHPAPAGLAPAATVLISADSNAHAAAICAEGGAEACVTTLVAARARGLVVIHSFGPVPMAFTLHLPRA